MALCRGAIADPSNCISRSAFWFGTGWESLDATAIAKIIESRDLIALVVLLGFLAVPLAKGMFAVVRGRDERRKEFLELWTQREHHKDDLWLESIVRHGYGV